MSCRDEFRRGKSSWFAEKLLQGWIPAGKIILIWRKCLVGMNSGGEHHLDLKEMSCRDEFQRGKSSWFAKKLLQGWIPAEKIILICRKSLGGMISSGEMHPDSAELLARDEFQWRNASWFGRMARQGWFPAAECILIQQNCLGGMIFQRRNVSWFGWLAEYVLIS